MTIHNPCPEELKESLELPLPTSLLSHENEMTHSTAAAVFAEISDVEEATFLSTLDKSISTLALNDSNEELTRKIDELEQVLLRDSENLKILHGKILVAVEKDRKIEERECYKAYCEEFNNMFSHVLGEGHVHVLNHLRYIDLNADKLGVDFVKQRLGKIDAITSIVLSFRERDRQRDRSLTQPWLDIKNMTFELYDYHVPLEKKTDRKISFSVAGNNIFPIPTRRNLLRQEEFAKRIEEAYLEKEITHEEGVITYEDDEEDSDEEDSLISSKPVEGTSSSINMTLKESRMFAFEKEAFHMAKYVESRIEAERDYEIPGIATECRVLYFRCLNSCIDKDFKISIESDILFLQANLMDVFKVHRQHCSAQLRKYEPQIEEIFHDFICSHQTVEWILRLK